MMRVKINIVKSFMFLITFSFAQKNIDNHIDVSTIYNILLNFNNSSFSSKDSKKIIYAKNFDFLQFKSIEVRKFFSVQDSFFKLSVDDKNAINEISYVSKGKELFGLSKLTSNKNSRIKIFELYKVNDILNSKTHLGYLTFSDSISPMYIKYKNINNDSLFEGLDYIMFLDGSLNVKSYCKFISGQLLYVSEIRYDENNKTLLKDGSVYIPKFPFRLTINTNFRELDVFNANTSSIYNSCHYILTANFDIEDTNLSKPLWFWNGGHDYK